MSDTDPDVIRLEESIVGAEKDIARRLENVNRMHAELTELRGGWKPSDCGNLILERDGWTGTVWQSSLGRWGWVVKRGQHFGGQVGTDYPTTEADARAAAEAVIRERTS